VQSSELGTNSAASDAPDSANQETASVIIRCGWVAQEIKVGSELADIQSKFRVA